MAETLKVLGQSVPVANALTDAYTVPAATQATVSSVVVANQNSGTTVFRVSIAVAGAADTAKQYLYYDLPLAGNDTFVATIGVTIGATDVIRVMSSLGNVSFNIFGVEVA